MRSFLPALAGLTALAACANGIARVHDDLLLNGPQSSDPTGAWLWFASLLLFVTALVLLPDSGNVHALRRAVGRAVRGPGTRYALGVLVIFALALVLRLWRLDTAPYNINPDEGDRAAEAIRILRGQLHPDVFFEGWYHIPVLYFWMLALPLKLFGVGYVQARLFGAVVSAASTALLFAMLHRHISRRAAWIAAPLAATLPIALESGRITNEGAPTALLWIAAAFLLLEGARTRRAWAWGLAGVAGAVSIYFYPSGRTWALVAAGFFAYHALGVFLRRDQRGALMGEGLALAMGAALAIGPYVAYDLLHPDVLTLRANQVAVFYGDNATRLPYYDPGMSRPELLWQQILHSVGVFGQFPDGSEFNPSTAPLFWGAYAVLFQVGLGWRLVGCLRDRRLFLFAAWFMVAFAGVVLTVETPSTLRLSAAIPLLPVFPALLLDAALGLWASPLARLAAGLVSRARHLPAQDAPRTSQLALDGALTLLVVVVAAQGVAFYFGPFAAHANQALGAGPNLWGRVVAAQPRSALVLSIGGESPMVNAGWVVLLAPDARRGEVKDPGFLLPFATSDRAPLAFVLGGEQAGYLPYLRAVYPHGHARTYVGTDGSATLYVYSVSAPAGRAPRERRGMPGPTETPAGTVRLLAPGEGLHVSVRTPQVQGASWRTGAIATCCLRDETGAIGPYMATWTGWVRAPRAGDYAFTVAARGAVDFAIDGHTLLHGDVQADPGPTVPRVRLRLARGLHRLRLVYTVTDGGPGSMELAWQPPGSALSIIPLRDLVPAPAPVHGVMGLAPGGVAPTVVLLQQTAPSIF